MCGGEEQAFSAIKDVMKCYGANLQLMGGAGAGQKTKIVNQIVLAGNLIGTVEGLIYGKKAGLNLEQLIDTIKTGFYKIYIYIHVVQQHQQLGVIQERE